MDWTNHFKDKNDSQRNDLKIMFLTAVLSFEPQYWPRVHGAYTF